MDRAHLAKTARRIARAEGVHPQAEISLVLADDAFLRDLNRRYRGVDRPTDVLSFPQTPQPAGLPPLLGDVAISVETAHCQAAAQGHSLEQELDWLVAHGVLHLVGWSDQTPEQLAGMIERQAEILGKRNNDRIENEIQEPG